MMPRGLEERKSGCAGLTVGSLCFCGVCVGITVERAVVYLSWERVLMGMRG